MKRMMCLLLGLMLLVPFAFAEQGGEPLKFSILSTNSGGLMYDYSKMDWFQEVARRANVDIEMELVDSQAYTDVLNTRLATGQDLPDVVRLGGTQAAYYADSGLFLDLTEYFEKDSNYINKMFEINPTLKAQITTVDGKKYFVPYVLTMESNERCLMINRQFCEALGMKVEDIKTLDDYYNYLKAVKENDCNGNGDKTDEVPLFVLRGRLCYLSVLFDYFGDATYSVNEDGQVICNYTDDRYKEYVTFFNKCYSEGLLYDEFSSAWVDIRSALFTNNRMGSIGEWISNTSGFSKLIDPNWNVREDDPIMVPVLVESISGQKWAMGRDSLGSMFAITKNVPADKAEAIFKFFDYLYSDEVGMLTWYGIEGIDYEIADGEIKFNDVYLNNEDSYLVRMGYNDDMWPGYQYDYMTKECPAVRKIAKEMADYILKPTVNFTFKTEDEQETLNTYESDLSTYFNENMVAFITGSRSLDTWDEYVAGAKQMGLDEVLAVYQAVQDRAE